VRRLDRRAPLRPRRRRQRPLEGRHHLRRKRRRRHVAVDTGTDTGRDTGTDSGSDAGTDTGSGSDSGTDTGSDTGTDSGTDADDGSADAADGDGSPNCKTAFSVTALGSGAYQIDGQNNPTLDVCKGDTVTFTVNSPGHPFWIKTVQSTGTGNAYNDGVTNNGMASATITWVVAATAPTPLFYDCEIHGAMTGTINVH
jgi:hypothetical protein